MAYVLLLDQVERQALTDRGAVLVAMATTGSSSADPPSLNDARARLDEGLLAEPKRRPWEQEVVLQALGVGNGGAGQH